MEQTGKYRLDWFPSCCTCHAAYLMIHIDALLNHNQQAIMQQHTLLQIHGQAKVLHVVAISS